ncbi:large ribosomal subunit protein mL64 [Phymastichus coffea]|uniref:large ribosomal subunit protein mL64 n=1 Tax=Phymastichus coffea TaxID=108790 RepID=UPI00273C7E69|nr:large ribosomal subunit protein mL64 [Phymastichus coffea]XP_058807130.1 large ribosomal subunit protein mL64 [Phymastichus coffea]
MSINLFRTRPILLSQQLLKNFSKHCYTTTSKGSIVSELEVEEVPIYEVEPLHDEEKLQKMCDISRLAPHHLNIIHGRKPYNQSYESYHDSVWYRKRMLGRYGIEAAEFHPGICWPTKEAIEESLEFERLAYPKSIQEVWKEIEEKKKIAAEKIRAREEYIDKTVAKFDEWRAALDAKIAKKEAEVQAAKEKKERLMAEIREQFGYNIDPRDERFKEILALKEKEDKKKKKEEKKKKKEAKLLSWLNSQVNEMNDKKDSQPNEEKAEEASSKPTQDAQTNIKTD